ncbi:N-acetyl-gamma-glutamyl-phosphate reductase [Aminobacter sp. NyZ550]|jgi:N-acetyl-gamma-glutamyl-phosphate reductase|uniref:N-acetyl-gamma-glutamyl-phosphate reductase n=1 Tax=Aminobacter aminovorans TaxID=83263 RepID=A0AAC8YRP0_AMIAI|nr:MULTISPECIES: N-acetyl-gamma-glutamyl-phosphate reductase [Aminobacter]AMS42939.1 N-acetyl-gamma-glutamyl-phosphate reductase [Aminobacter aminovorans]MBB3704790.1 N-acetyl-gamma-glutamyl-phosphate reductase [Aminobacter aminovorans]MRX34258.1 N-acetyl-gamma-glutamyl-phosphate reductase [Aminobacter sp. MDW-2]QNH32979.1 N-acetyl-gamma-glutamyl-phosphate reductase [Aminobacter sp. MDW-2]WAX93922.1 N-acetyl-gamma-glutamyl-phosphate reductase [Aminobacter sp. NyZ550]
MKPKIFIDGEHGTTGLQIRTRLAARDDLAVLSIPEAERRNVDLRAERLHEADVAILCLPDDASKEAVRILEGNNSTRIIDTSTAHRVHPDWAYGFAEMDAAQRKRIADARLVANPGCYPTGAISLIRPLVAAGTLPADYPVSVNAVSGYTGGGKQMIGQMEDASRPDHIAAPHFLYGLPLMHKHVAEMKQHGLLERRPIFAPSVGRFAQGMIVQVPLHLADLNGSASIADIHATLAAHYAGQEIVEVVPLEVSAKLDRLDPTELADTDGMKLYVFGTEGQGQVNLVALLDNLGKGASGAAVQNMDLMLGLKH